MNIREFVRREAGPIAVVAFLVALMIFTAIYIGVTDHTWADWWVNFWEG